MRAVVIGGANVDIISKSHNKIIHADSNPAEVTLKSGGVARNIAEQLAKNGVETQLITAIGDDFFGEYLKNKSKKYGICTKAWIIKAGESTGVYSAALDSDGELYTAFNAMALIEAITPEDFFAHKEIIQSADIMIVDTNLSEDTLKAVFEIRGDRPSIAEAVSAFKVNRLKKLLDKIHYLKLNKYEAEQLTKISADSRDNIEKMCKYLIGKGVRRVFITLGADGLYATEKSDVIYLPAEKIEVHDVTGAGDAFVAGIAIKFEEDLLTQAKFGARLATEFLKGVCNE